MKINELLCCCVQCCFNISQFNILNVKSCTVWDSSLCHPPEQYISVLRSVEWLSACEMRFTSPVALRWSGLHKDTFRCYRGSLCLNTARRPCLQPKAASVSGLTWTAASPFSKAFWQWEVCFHLYRPLTDAAICEGESVVCTNPLICFFPWLWARSPPSAPEEWTTPGAIKDSKLTRV